jgi:hypothetical protein
LTSTSIVTRIIFPSHIRQVLVYGFPFIGLLFRLIFIADSGIQATTVG